MIYAAALGALLAMGARGAVWLMAWIEAVLT
jgi:hypothetical protein